MRASGRGERVAKVDKGRFALGRRAFLLAAAVGLVAGGCGAPVESERALPESPPVVVITMDEYRFDYEPTIPAGRVVFIVRNAGRVEHRLALLPLAEDLAPIDDQLRGSERRAITPFAGVPNRPPGQSGTFAVNLVAGQRYGLICFVQEADGTSHAQKGMSSEFRALASLDEPGQ